MISFKEKVFDGILRDTTEVFSDTRFDEVIGSADSATVEVEVEEVISGSATLTARWWHSNSGKGFTVLSTLATTQSLASLPFRGLYNQAGPFGALSRIGLMLSTTGVVRARVWITGRTS